MGPRRMHPAVLKYDDLIGIHHGADPLGNDYLCYPRKLFKLGTYLTFRRRIHG